MPLNWDDDEEELTEIEYRKRPKRALIHEEITAPGLKSSEPSHQVPRTEPPEFSPPRQPTTPAPLPTTQSKIPSGISPAPLKDRFAAFIIDSLIGFYFYWFSGWVLSRFFETPNIAMLHQSSGRFSLHLILTLLVFLFYYLIFESVFGATLGKFFCRLRVTEENGSKPSLGNVFIRNILRIVDYPLLFLVAVITMESSPLNQRLGDRSAKTIIIKKTRRYLPVADLKHTPLASTLSRMFAEILDLCFAITLAYSFILFISSKHPYFSTLLFYSSPVAFLAYYIFAEFFTGTTPGKAIFKRQVILDNGEPPDGTSAIIRNFFRPLDYLIGYPLMVITKRKQRLGDLASDTFVISKPTQQKGVLISIAIVLVILLFGYAGYKNPDSAIRKEYGLTPLQGLKVFLPPFGKPIVGFQKGGLPIKKNNQTQSKGKKSKTPLPESTSEKLKLVEYYFATGPEPTQIRHDRKFRQGDLVYTFFKIQGFELNSKNEANLTEDILVEDPKGNVILSQPKVVQMEKLVEGQPQEILFANNIPLPKDAPKGNYRVLYTIYDKVADTQYSFEKSFILQ